MAMPLVFEYYIEKIVVANLSVALINTVEDIP